ncbi:hypothetical protein C0995_009351 [Termitomyces sp. Mi166|nr:hypothetical protein C0995_009351 [Termitomyces sp. Mi166\
MHPGSEPGINPRRVSARLTYGNFRQACVIEVADYDADNATLRRMGNDELVSLMNEPCPRQDSLPSVSSSTTPSRVRWINIGGLDWDVMSAVALRYNLHVLALEDVLHEQGHDLSKADYYHEHLFIRILCHTLDRDNNKEEELRHESSKISDLRTEFSDTWHDEQRRMSQESEEEVESTLPTSVPLTSDLLHIEAHRRTMSVGLTGFWGMARRQRVLRLKALTKGDRVNVRHEPMSIFLLKNGTLLDCHLVLIRTVITIHPKADLEFTAPVRERLLHPESVLRTSEDASLLVEGLLDLGKSGRQFFSKYPLVVDRALEIMDEYQDKIHQVEHDVLLKPGLDTLRSLHILSGDLIMHKRTLDPIKVLIHGLRHYDLDRCVVLANYSEAEAGFVISTGASSAPPQKVQGYLSYKAKLYLSDVSDHIEFVLTSLDMFAGLSENLINFAFNVRF